VQSCFWPSLTRPTILDAIVPKVMILLIPLTGHEAGSASRADAIAPKTRGDLRDVSDRAVCPLPERETLPPVAASKSD
jgi:hypothetical protein